jgi:hypothetical protein
MSRLWALSLVVCVLSLSSGCAMCCAPFDWDYQSVAGRYTRNNPSSGRVGSAFDDAGGVSETIVTSAAEPSIPTVAPEQAVPGTRSVIPRTMGESYLQPAQ